MLAFVCLALGEPVDVNGAWLAMVEQRLGDMVLRCDARAYVVELVSRRLASPIALKVFERSWLRRLWHQLPPERVPPTGSVPLHFSCPVFFSPRRFSSGVAHSYMRHLGMEDKSFNAVRREIMGLLARNGRGPEFALRTRVLEPVVRAVEPIPGVLAARAPAEVVPSRLRRVLVLVFGIGREHAIAHVRREAVVDRRCRQRVHALILPRRRSARKGPMYP